MRNPWDVVSQFCESFVRLSILCYLLEIDEINDFSISSHETYVFYWQQLQWDNKCTIKYRYHCRKTRRNHIIVLTTLSSNKNVIKPGISEMCSALKKKLRYIHASLNISKRKTFDDVLHVVISNRIICTNFASEWFWVVFFSSTAWVMEWSNTCRTTYLYFFLRAHPTMLIGSRFFLKKYQNPCDYLTCRFFLFLFVIYFYN